MLEHRSSTRTPCTGPHAPFSVCSSTMLVVVCKACGQRWADDDIPAEVRAQLDAAHAFVTLGEA